MSVIEFDAQISHLRPALLSLTRRFTSDKEESRDLVQDTLLKALTFKHRFREDTNLKGWLFIIMRNTFINSYRKNKRVQALNDTTKDLHFLNTSDTHTFNSPVSWFEYNDILKSVRSLGDDLLVPFQMHASGYKYHEIAQHQNIPIGTVKNRIFKARQVIQKNLTDNGY